MRFQMSIRKKISSGFVVIGIILFFSGVIAIFEFSRMSRSLSVLITNNMKTINTSRKLLDICDEANFGLLKNLGGDMAGQISRQSDRDARFDEYLSAIRSSYTTLTEAAVADSIVETYGKYVGIINNSDSVWVRSYQDRRDWYFTQLQPVYYDLRTFINDLAEISQQELTKNSSVLRDSFYRSIMPGVVSVAAGIILVLLFNYFINYYLISPIMLISKGLRSYLEMRKNYNVKFENDDELQDLNRNVKELVDENKKLRKIINQSQKQL